MMNSNKNCSIDKKNLSADHPLLVLRKLVPTRHTRIQFDLFVALRWIVQLQAPNLQASKMSASAVAFVVRRPLEMDDREVHVDCVILIWVFQISYRPLIHVLEYTAD